MNPQGSITLDNAVAAFRPFDEIRGSVAWDLGSLPKSLELRLFWCTGGCGVPEAGVVQIQSLPLTSEGEATFSFSLPGAPYSVRGKLITLTWALELVANPIGSLALKEFVVGPEKQPVELPAIEQIKPSWWKAWRGNR